MINLTNSKIGVLAPIETLQYHDIQTIMLSKDISPLEAWNHIMEDPQPLLKAAFKVRDVVSNWFGVKSIGGFSGKPRAAVKQGDFLDFFLVEHSDETTLVLTERDRHLDVMTCVSVEDRKISITSSVLVHNLFGRIYMVPVGIAHRFIVRNMLARLQSKLSAST